MTLTGSPAFSRILPFAIYMAFLAVDSGITSLQGMGYIEDWDLRWLYPVKAGMVLLALAWLWRNYSELAVPVGIKARDWLVAVVSGVIVFVVWINLDHGWATLGGDSTDFDPTSENGQIDWLLVAFRLAGAALIVPVMEELFWRSFIMRWIDKQNFLSVNPRRVSLKSFVITAVLFGFEHDLWLAGICAGVVYGWLYLRGGSLWMPVLSHAVTNGLLGLWVIQTGNWQFW